MKLLYISESSPELLSPGSNRARATIKYLRQNSCDVYDFDISKQVSVGANLGKGAVEGGIVYRLRQSIRMLDGRVFSKFFIGKLSKILRMRRCEFDLVYVSYKPPIALFLGVVAKILFGARLVIEYRDLASLFKNKPIIYPLHFIDIVIDRFILWFANAVIVVSPTQAETLRQKFSVKAEIVFNGFDIEPELEELDRPREKSWITYVGTLSKRRSLKGLAHIRGIENYTLNVLSDCDPLIFEPPVGLNVDHLDVMPRQQMMMFIQRSSYLLLIEGLDEASYANVPSKVFEYISTRNTILFIGSEFSDVYQILLQYGNFIHLNGQVEISSKVACYEDIEEFNRSYQAEKLDRILHAVH
jgi:hypothetical protein